MGFTVYGERDFGADHTEGTTWGGADDTEGTAWGADHTEGTAWGSGHDWLLLSFLSGCRVLTAADGSSSVRRGWTDQTTERCRTPVSFLASI